MASFSDKVFQVFRNLASQHRFVPVRVGASIRHASLIRREVDNVFSYVFVRDGRSTGGNLDVDMWIAPPDEAGDGLDRLNVGYMIRIGSEYQVDGSFFFGCQKRIVTFLRAVHEIVPLVQEELANPSVRTERWSVYQLERRVISWVLANAIAGDVRANAVTLKARQMTKAKSLTALEEACVPVANWILRKRCLDDDVLTFYDQNAGLLAGTIAIHLYVWALGEASAGKC